VPSNDEDVADVPFEVTDVVVAPRAAGSSSLAGAGPTMKWLYTYGPATTTTATNATTPTSTQVSLCRRLVAIAS